MKRIAVLALALAFCLCFTAFGETAEGIPANLEGSYTDLFPAFRQEAYNDMWQAALESIGVAEDKADAVKDAFLSCYEADVYGAAAVELAEADPSYFSFDCFMTGNVDVLTISGNTISGKAADGSEVFSHEYTYYGTLKIDYGAMNEIYGAFLTEETWPTMDVYAADTEDGEFTYFAFCGDNPVDTYHIEFRYGSKPEELAQYFTGDYAYWLAACIFENCDAQLMQNCIELFVTENADSLLAIAEAF